jgi:hypothetical protein
MVVETQGRDLEPDNIDGESSELGASVEAPDLLDLTVVQSHFETERLAWVSFDVAQTLNQFIHVVGDGHDLAARKRKLARD